MGWHNRLPCIDDILVLQPAGTLLQRIGNRRVRIPQIPDGIIDGTEGGLAAA